MKTYWDYTDQEQANMTEETVKSLMDVELMTKGVKSAKSPVLMDVPKSPLGQKRKFYSVLGKGRYGSDEAFGVCFETMESARAFMDLLPQRRDYDYEVGSEFEYCMPVTDMKIEVVELYSRAAINEFRSELKSRKAKQEANEKAQAEFNKACEASEKITAHVWEDWSSKRQTLADLRSIAATYREYLRLTENQSDLALTFLAKVHSPKEIQKAREWFPDEIPNATPKPQPQEAK